MKLAKRLQQTVYYSMYLGRKPVAVDGLYTGEYTIEYADPAPIGASVTPAKGGTEAEMFGLSEDYDKIITVEGASWAFNEATRFWIDAKPTEPADYAVVRVAQSKNLTAVAVRKVKQ